MSLSAGRPSKTSKQATLADMADSKKTVRVNFDIDSDEHKRLKLHALMQGKTVRQVLSDFISTLPNSTVLNSKGEYEVPDRGLTHPTR
ncbi:MAG: chromosome partitioning protein ParB [Moraxellaceae bacterium]|jgi:hypothetical protein|nr:chromosome partitioning protein ParB [Moraxellaceae bacterium]